MCMLALCGKGPVPSVGRELVIRRVDDNDDVNLIRQITGYFERFVALTYEILVT